MLMSLIITINIIEFIAYDVDYYIKKINCNVLEK